MADQKSMPGRPGVKQNYTMYVTHSIIGQYSFMHSFNGTFQKANIFGRSEVTSGPGGANFIKTLLPYTCELNRYIFN